MSTEKIEIVPYKDEWPVEFLRVKNLLLEILDGLEVGIEHIGSTSVPGLAAKDCIDIQITIPSFESDLLQSINMKLVANNFPELQKRRDHRPPLDESPDSHWDKYFLKNAPVDVRANIHVRASGNANQKYPLLFRDFLRAHPAIAAAYAETKSRLAGYVGGDMDAYCEIKDPVCDIILEEAKHWAEVIGWTVDHDRIENYECCKELN